MNPKNQKRRARKLKEQHVRKSRPEIVHGCLVKDWSPDPELFLRNHPGTVNANDLTIADVAATAGEASLEQPKDDFQLISMEPLADEVATADEVALAQAVAQASAQVTVSGQAKTWTEYLSSFFWH